MHDALNKLSPNKASLSYRDSSLLKMLVAYLLQL